VGSEIDCFYRTKNHYTVFIGIFWFKSCEGGMEITGLSKWKFLWFVTQVTLLLFVITGVLLFLGIFPTPPFDNKILDSLTLGLAFLATPPFYLMSLLDELLRDSSLRFVVRKFSFFIIYPTYFLALNALIFRIFYTMPPYSISHHVKHSNKAFFKRMILAGILMYGIFFGSFVMSV